MLHVTELDEWFRKFYPERYKEHHDLEPRWKKSPTGRLVFTTSVTLDGCPLPPGKYEIAPNGFIYPLE